MPHLAKAIYPKKVKLVEVGPRDGLQFEPNIVSTETKIELIDRLSLSKMPVIECTSYILPKLVPQFADSRLIGPGIKRSPGIKYLVERLNL